MTITPISKAGDSLSPSVVDKRLSIVEAIAERRIVHCVLGLAGRVVGILGAI